MMPCHEFESRAIFRENVHKSCKTCHPVNILKLHGNRKLKTNWARRCWNPRR